MDVPPTMQMLHCIVPVETGGLSTVADATAAALYMRKHSPAHFRLLATVPVDFHRRQKAFEKSFVGPIITIDATGASQTTDCGTRTRAQRSGGHAMRVLTQPSHVGVA